MGIDQLLRGTSFVSRCSLKVTAFPPVLIGLTATISTKKTISGVYNGCGSEYRWAPQTAKHGLKSR
ncbi:MAG: hypothetical protein CMM01_23560 [Rhodopirellula sp.]|nr:hypothetical protein [Rhodopirellula sp.]OUX49249.1 MAG: hypothetical protein CBE43_10470 [Rhodopirellula sp. TMED283]